MDYTLVALNEAALEIGKAVILYATEWDGTADLTLTHLGDTEGAVVFDAQEAIGRLNLPEVYGPGSVRSWVVGADPTLTAPMFLATPALRTLLSPTGDGLIGSGARRPTVRKTLVVFPQTLYYNATTGKNDAKIRFTTALGWEKSAEASGDPDAFAALTADETRLLGLSIWIWAAYADRPTVTFEATVEDVVKNIEQVTFHAERPTATALDGAMVMIGDPADYNIDIDPA